MAKHKPEVEQDPDRPTETPATSAAEEKYPASEPVLEADLTPKQLRMNELRKLLGECLKEHGGESNIGVSHDYWRWLSELRALMYGTNAG